MLCDADPEASRLAKSIMRQCRLGIGGNLLVSKDREDTHVVASYALGNIHNDIGLVKSNFSSILFRIYASSGGR